MGKNTAECRSRVLEAYCTASRLAITVRKGLTIVTRDPLVADLLADMGLNVERDGLWCRFTVTL